MKKKPLIILIVVALIVVAAGIYYYFYYQKSQELAEVIPKAAVSNPLEKMPETNPFEKAVNPFKDLYQNPFK